MKKAFVFIPIFLIAIQCFHDNEKMLIKQPGRSLISVKTINQIKFSKNIIKERYKSRKIKNIIFRNHQYFSSEKINQGILLENGKDLIYTYEIKINGIKYGSSFDLRRESKYDMGFYESGKLHFGNLYHHTVIDGVCFKENTLIEYYESGKVKSGTLCRPQNIHGIHYSSRGTFAPLPGISFFENGKVKQGILLKPQYINGFKCSWNYRPQKEYDIQFYSSGNIKEGYLGYHLIMNGIHLKKWRKIEFFDNGQIKFKYHDAMKSPFTYLNKIKS